MNGLVDSHQVDYSVPLAGEVLVRAGSSGAVTTAAVDLGSLSRCVRRSDHGETTMIRS